MRGAGDRLIYRKARWKAVLIGIMAFPMLAVGVTIREWVPTMAWPLFGLLFLAVGVSLLFHAVRDAFGHGRLIVSREGLELIGEGRRVWLLWWQIERIVVGYDSDGPGALEVWTGGIGPSISTSGWDRTPSQIAADIKRARERWRSEGPGDD